MLNLIEFYFLLILVIFIQGISTHKKIEIIIWKEIIYNIRKSIVMSYTIQEICILK